MTAGTFAFEPIGVVRSPFDERVSAPRQPRAARGVEGTIELFAGHDFEHALCDLDGFEYLWVIFVFDRNVGAGWRPKVLPPRSPDKRRGVFATRAPYRPNPIGLSSVKLLRIEGLVLHVAELDILDGTPVLDLKPYLPYADAHPDAKSGWLVPADPDPGWEVRFSARAEAELAWLSARGVELAEPIAKLLALGPQPHPYRRIRKEKEGFRLAMKEWRVFFRVEGRMVEIDHIESGYRPSQLASDPALALHRAFAEECSQ